MTAQRKATAVAGRGLEYAERLASLYRPEQCTAPPRRRKCPYHDEVAKAVTAGLNPNVYLFAGPGAWDFARWRRDLHGMASALVLPPGADPASLAWPPVDALVVDACALDGAEREALARALIGDGVRFVCLIHPDGATNVRASWSAEVTP